MKFITTDNEILSCSKELANNEFGDMDSLTFPLKANVTVEFDNKIVSINCFKTRYLFKQNASILDVNTQSVCFVL